MKDRDPELDLRMVEYWVRVRRQERERRTPIARFVLVLGDDVVVPERCLEQGREVLCWTVVRLGELDPAPLLERPTSRRRPSLSGGGTHSPQVTFRLPDQLHRQAVDAAEREGKTG